MRNIIVIAFVFCFGYSYSQTDSYDSIGHVLSGKWRFDTVPGRHIEFVFLTNDPNGLFVDHHSIRAKLVDSAKDNDWDFMLVPKSSLDDVARRPHDAGPEVYVLMKEGTFSEFRYKIMSIVNNTFVMVDMRSSRKHTTSYKLTKVK